MAIDWSLVQHVRWRIKRDNRNWIAIVYGETGSGKSYAAMSLAKLVDGNFNERRVVFTPKAFFKLLDSGKVKKHQAIVWDEAGVGMSARNFYEVINKMTTYVLQAFRNDNLALIITTPAKSYIDKNVRLLFHHELEPVSIDKDKKTTDLKLLRCKYSNVKGEVYQKYHRARDPETGNSVKITRVRVPHPPGSLVKKYEEKKRRFTEQLKENAASAASPQSKEPQKLKDPRGTAVKLYREYGDKLLKKNGKVDKAYIRSLLPEMRGVDRDMVRSIIEKEIAVELKPEK